jgi:hypothetical protein
VRLVNCQQLFIEQLRKADQKKKRPIQSKKKPKYQTNFIVKAAIPFTLHSGYIVFSSNEAWINSKFSACRM